MKTRLEKLQGDKLEAGRLDYIKNVILRWMQYVMVDDPKQVSLIPVIATVLELTESEKIGLQPRKRFTV